jgi:lysophospholipase L1-like esterase
MDRLFVGAGVVLAILRNRVLRLILSALAVLALSGHVQADGITPRIMPLGDSITKGVCGSPVKKWGYRQPLYVSLTGGGYNFDFVGCKVDGSFPDPNHEGRDGWKANELLNGRPSVPAEGKLADWLSKDQPDVILLHIGTNDITGGDQSANEVNAILDVIDAYEDASDKNVTVILALIINRSIDSPSTKRSQTTQFNSDVNIMATGRVANGDDIIIVDMESALDYNVGVDMADEVHPNDNGYIKMANVWYIALAEYFSGFSISGYVREASSNAPVEGVLIQACEDINTVTDANGFYELWVDYRWSGVVAPQNDGYIFGPNGFSYTNVNQDYADMNYTATPKYFKITGFVFEQDYVTPINDVNVSADNGGGSALTDADGYYELWVEYNWSGNVTASKYACAFEPESIHYEVVNRDYTDQDYTGNQFNFRITGFVSNDCNVPVKDVLVDADNGGGKGLTDAYGFYEVWVDEGWSGTVAASRQYYTFAPNLMSYVNVQADVADQNYIADSIYDLDCDGSIGWGDFEIIANNWLLTGPAIPGDFIVDGTVNFLDFAEFKRVWQD